MAVANPPLGSAAATRAPSRATPRTSRLRLGIDRAARWVVTVGGLAIIASPSGRGDKDLNTVIKELGDMH